MDKYYAGQIVISKQGKDTGKIYIVAYILLNDNRLALADGERFNIKSKKLKLKNPAHVEIMHNSSELAEIIKQGKDINKGRLCQILAGLNLKNA